MEQGRSYNDLSDCSGEKINFYNFFVFCDFYFIVMNFVEFVGAGGGGGRDKVVTGVCERRLVEFMYMA